VVAWVEYGPAGYITHVARLEGGSWVALGAALPSGSSSASARPNVDLALAPDGSPYVAYTLRNGLQDDIMVSHLVSGAWQALPRVPSDIAQQGFALALDPAQRPVVAFVNDTRLSPFRELAVARYENGAWNLIGGIAHVNGALAYLPAVAIDASGVRYVAWEEQFASGGIAASRPYAWKVDGTGSGDLGTPNAGIDYFGAGPALAFDDAGELVMSWADFPDQTTNAYSLGVRVHALRGAAWVALGDVVPGLAGGIPMHALALNRSTHRLALSTVYSTKQPDDFVAGVHEFDGQAWHTLCDPVPDASSASGNAEGLTSTGLAWDPVSGSYVIAAASIATGSSKLFVARVHP
jgi:hypothetical protein